MSGTVDNLAGLPMFDEPRARASDPKTSHAAAESMVGPAAAQRKIITDALAYSGPQCADMLDYAIGWRPTTAGRRLKELEKAGLVERTDLFAPTRSGRSAQVWKLKGPS